MTSSFVFGPAQLYVPPDRHRPVRNNNNDSLQFFSRIFNSTGFGYSKLTTNPLLLSDFARNSNGRLSMADSRGADYAEIMVVRHGETAWNADVLSLT